MSLQDGQGKTGTGLAAGAAVTIFGPLNFVGDVTPWEVAIKAAAKGTTPSFRLEHQMTPDGGTTWHTLAVAASGAITQTQGVASYDVACSQKWEVTSDCRVRLVNTSAANLDYAYDVRLQRGA